MATRASLTCGLLVAPVFSYKPGTLFMEEHTLCKMMNQNGCSVDLAYQLLFDPKSKTDTELMVSIVFIVTCCLPFN